MEVRETATISEKAASAAKSTGKMLVQFISPGWGSSGYYSPEVLQEAAAERVIPAGTHMYADHPSERDRKERPERSIRDLVAVTTSDAQLSANGALVGEVRVLAPYQELITDLKDYIGVSVLGDAKDIFEGEAEGRSGKIIAGLAHINSVDFVTRAGRGGQVLELLESARAGELSESLVEVLPDSWLQDGIHVELAEALEEIATSAAGAEGTAKLHAYWRHGEGAAKIRWGVAGDFNRCVEHLGKYVADPKGYCAKMHKDVTGATPGHAAGESASDERVITILESGLGLDEEGHTYRYKHGWIPLGHTAEDKDVAKLSLSQRQSYANHRSSGMSHEEALGALVKGHQEDLKTANKMGYKPGTSVHNNHSDMLKQAKKALGGHKSRNTPNSGGSHSPGSITTPRGAEHPALNNPGAKKSVTRPGDHADFSKMSDSDLSAAISRAEKSDSPAVKKLLPGLRSEQAKRGGGAEQTRLQNALKTAQDGLQQARQEMKQQQREHPRWDTNGFETAISQHQATIKNARRQLAQLKSKK